MGLILSEPIKKVVEILKILAKMSVEDAKNHPKRPYIPLSGQKATRFEESCLSRQGQGAPKKRKQTQYHLPAFF
jgi:hypothetical protein